MIPVNSQLGKGNVESQAKVYGKEDSYKNIQKEVLVLKQQKRTYV